MCLLVSVLAIYLIVGQFRAHYRTQKSKTVILMGTVVVLSLLYVAFEVRPFRLFDRAENLLRQTLFLLCFLYFFRHINLVNRRPRLLAALLFLSAVIMGTSLASCLLLPDNEEECLRGFTSWIFEVPHRD